MTGALDFTSQFTLAARAVASLPPRLDLAALVDIAREHIQIFVIEASAFRAISGFPTAPPPASPSVGATAPAGFALLWRSGCALCFSRFRVFAHESDSPLLTVELAGTALGAQLILDTDWRICLGRLLDFAFISHE